MVHLVMILNQPSSMTLFVWAMRLEYWIAPFPPLEPALNTVPLLFVKVCQPKNQILVLLQVIPADLSTSSSNCTHGALRLSGAITSNQGRLEVCMKGAWGSVCDSQGVFSTTEAKVACRQLGKLQIEGTCS